MHARQHGCRGCESEGRDIDVWGKCCQVARSGSVIVDRKAVSVHVAFPPTVVDPKSIEGDCLFEKDLCDRCNKLYCFEVCRGYMRQAACLKLWNQRN